VFKPAVADEEGNFTFRTYEEEWRLVPEYPDYAVSNYGEVYSFPRKIVRLNSQSGQPNEITVRGGMLNHSLSVHGYPRVQLSRPGEKIKKYVHSIVAETFIGPRPDGMETCHNDGIKTNPEAWNLRHDKPKGNNSDMDKHGTRVKGEDISNARYTNEEIRNVKMLLKKHGVMDVSRLTGIPQPQISNIKTGHTWKHIVVSEQQLPLDAPVKPGFGPPK
jgi:hypothetical protein